MSSAAAIRLQIETKLANRVPAALTLKIKQAPELFATGIAEVDAALSGGIAVDGILLLLILWRAASAWACDISDVCAGVLGLSP